MRESHLQLLCCPDCQSELFLVRGQEDGVHVMEGRLLCKPCGAEYAITRGIPRFAPIRSYVDGFEFQWNKHALTQHDSHSKTTISEDRFFEETGWSRNLANQVVLEVGCGSGRFTAQAISTQATVVSTDLSGAVDANFAIHRDCENLLIIQADIFRMPVRQSSFDKLFCFGVLQHAPDVKRAFLCLPEYLKPGGKLAVDVYDKRTGFLRIAEIVYRTYRWLRPVTKRLPPKTLYRFVKAYVSVMWPISKMIHQVPWIGVSLNRMLMIVDYRDRYSLSEELLKDWATLDAFDMLSPAYDQRQTIDAFRGWFHEAPLEDVDVHYGFNGIEGRATKTGLAGRPADDESLVTADAFWS